jgi:hypothetical protein
MTQNKDKKYNTETQQATSDTWHRTKTKKYNTETEQATSDT